MAEVSKAEKQLLSEKLWLLYFNEALYRDGVITKDAYLKMSYRINSRTKLVRTKRKERSG